MSRWRTWADDLMAMASPGDRAPPATPPLLPPPSWPAAVGATFRHQLRLLLHSRLTLVFQLAFLIALQVATFLIADLFSADDASLDVTLGFLPWVAMIFTPALAMKAFVGRSLDREREFLLTLPLPAGAVAIGAWAAGSVVLLVTLAFTAPLSATLAWLGRPDFGVMAAAYVGAGLLLVSFYAVGLFASATARSETGAFALALALLFALLMLGWDGVGRLAPSGFSGGPFEVAAYASPKFWLERISAGRIELRAVAYFAALTALALFGATAALKRRGPIGNASLAHIFGSPRGRASAKGATVPAPPPCGEGKGGGGAERRGPADHRAAASDPEPPPPPTPPHKGEGRREPLSLLRSAIGGWLGFASGAALGLVLAGLVVGATPARFALDLTEARRFTLSDATVALARRLPEGARVDFYWSAGRADLPAAVRAYAAEVAGTLALVAERSDGRLAFSAHDVDPDSDGERPALEAGVRRTPLSSGDAFFFGAVFSAGDRRIPIAYFDGRRAGSLEYDVATALSGLARERAPRVGIVTPLVAPGDPNAADAGFNALNELRRAYDVAIVPPFADRLPEDLDAVVVAGATFLKREMLYSIDQAVMRGAGLVAMIDPRLRLAPASDSATPAPSEEVDDISDLLARYGARYAGAEVVGDAALATPVADQSQRTLSYPYWMRFGRAEISPDHAVTAGLGDLLFAEAGAFAAAPGKALVTTTAAAGVIAARELAERTPAGAAALFRPGGGARIVAAELDGPFASAFETPPGGGAVVHLPRGKAAAAVFAVADVDWILDPFAYEPEGEPGAPRRPRNDNVALFLNMVERAAGGGDLAAIRSRGERRRPLDKVAETAKNLAGREGGDERAAAMTRIAEIEKRINGLPAAAGVADLSRLPREVQAQVAELRARLAPDRKLLREAERQEREAVEQLRSRVILFNLAAGPALAFAFSGLVALVRRRRQGLGI